MRILGEATDRRLPADLNGSVSQNAWELRREKALDRLLKLPSAVWPTCSTC